MKIFNNIVEIGIKNPNVTSGFMYQLFYLRFLSSSPPDHKASNWH
ncbi:hypothetical protein SAMN05421679_102443 [Epilithonimonas pallida]|uniref:Uncharacterized protein n=1 Tax=Epilithonimonas pallida TaxID=373671 RepID=A0ABY1QZP8_9FLAO|nr:hypothetical protein SAMN05421679_102443 [Epilithonimonas pallida]